MTGDVFPNPRGRPAQQLSDLAARRTTLAAAASYAQSQLGLPWLNQPGLTDELDAAKRAADDHRVALAAGLGVDPGDGPRLDARCLELEERVAELEAEARVSRAAAAQVDGQIARHAVEHADELRGEVFEDAVRARDRLVAALVELSEAFTGWQDVHARDGELCRVAHPELARLGVPPVLDPDVERLARRVPVDVPIPALRDPRPQPEQRPVREVTV